MQEIKKLINEWKILHRVINYDRRIVSEGKKKKSMDPMLKKLIWLLAILVAAFAVMHI